MKVGIVVYSLTGHTLSVAERLKEEIINKGNTVTIEQLSTTKEKITKIKDVELIHHPDIHSYDVVIFGGPVYGFTIAPVLKVYLDEIKTLENQKIACFVTQFFPLEWLGGNQAIRNMKKICEEKQGTVYQTGIVNWTNKRENKITRVVNALSQF